MGARYFLTALAVVVLAVVCLSACGGSDGGGAQQPTQTFFNVGANFCQYHYLDFGPNTDIPDSPFGGATLAFDLPVGPYFFNCVIQATSSIEWQIKNLPVFGRGVPTELCVPIDWTAVQRDMGPQVLQVDTAFTLSSLPLTLPPDAIQLLPVQPYALNYAEGIVNAVIPTVPAIVEQPFIFDFPVETPKFECGMHVTFTNQECGVNECCPAAVSNSMKTIGVSTAAGPGGVPPGGPLEINDMKGPTQWGAGGTPIDWFTNKGASLMASHGVTTATTAVPATEAGRITTICDMLKALNDGKDVEVQNGHHIAMVTGVWKLTIGGKTSYFVEVAHDTNQGASGGTVNEMLEYDPATNTFSGGVPGFFPGTSPTHFTVETKP